MDRRDILKLAAALAGLPVLQGCERVLQWGVPLTLRKPGMKAGHRLRAGIEPPEPRNERRCKVAVVGSGAAGLFAAWRLVKEGWTDVVVLNGPEPDGNAAGGAFGECRYPTGAHYLPLPSRESVHVRELLAEMGVIEADPYGLRPRFDERVVVHAPDERLWVAGHWQDGLLPRWGMPPAELAEQNRFLAQMAQLRNARGADGRKAFCIPLALSSRDPQWTGLDQISFSDWLDANGYRAPGLRWYLDYCCRDDYGVNLSHASAWAGLHYFCSRGGLAANADEGAVLTWPDGLNPVMRHMRARIGAERQQPGIAWRVQGKGSQVRVDYLDARGDSQRLLADRVILAVPLFVAMHLYDQLQASGIEHSHLPARAPWLVSNFLIDRFPAEPAEMPLAWDNVVYGSKSLGYVVSTHQQIRVAKPARSVFTAYHAFAEDSAYQARQRLERADADSLFETAAADLLEVYGWRFRQGLLQVEMTARGHAMASPTPGFLSNRSLQVLREADGPVLFAHSDLSGLSLFEEAAWWGEQAARKILA
ncbi:NAD(P)-binding protein [Chromobacterium sp. IIBBL 290-4]|uniref:NAD(P)-binding protein n=1 Tax=Chromobacterium sp. IIBBL 290-4 TaxID=2953890 RepID=UPI0020B89CA0|nr:NAD(P)-binding protein [Chromobacterium sp. IIBBL 290-4]UTH75970.1 NAD(P)-binding protein [Chromobacterium sp. IIBBL 290-4]